MWYKVRELQVQGLNNSQIAMEVGIYRSTVSRYLSMDEQEFQQWVSKPRHRPRKLEAYYCRVKQMLIKQPFLSCAQVEDRLKEVHEDLPAVNSKTVYNFVEHIRREEGIAKESAREPRPYEMQAEEAYGAKSEADFGEAFMLDHEGRRVKVHFFVMVLSRSRYKHAVFQTQPFTQWDMAASHQACFERFGGMTKRVVYDQDRVLLKDENMGDPVMTNAFSRYRSEAGFEAVFCRRSDPESKGKVESLVKYVKRNFLRGREFRGIELLNLDAVAWLDRTANAKVHGTTRKVPMRELEKERRHLTPLRAWTAGGESRAREYRVRKDNTVAWKGNFYSVPTGTYKGQGTTVMVEEKEGSLHIWQSGTGALAQHRVPAVNGTLVRDQSHLRDRGIKADELRAKAMEAMGDHAGASDYLDRLRQQKGRYYLDNLRLICRKLPGTPPPVLGQALERCAGMGVYNAALLARLVEELSVAQEVSCEGPVTGNGGEAGAARGMVPERSDIEQYQRIMR
jgi:transposase